ncbi:TPA: hypothetical protein ACU8BU_000269 [Neisseria subflava]
MKWQTVNQATACVRTAHTQGKQPSRSSGSGQAVCCYDTGVSIYKGVWRSHTRGWCESGYGLL